MRGSPRDRAAGNQHFKDRAAQIRELLKADDDASRTKGAEDSARLVSDLMEQHGMDETAATAWLQKEVGVPPEREE